MSWKTSVMGSGLWRLLPEMLSGRKRPFDCLQVEVSTRCPGQCTYCPHTTMRGRWRSLDMTMATFDRLGPLLHRAERVHLQGWGEPFLNPAFFAMAARATGAGCQVSTTTCGLGLDRNRAEALVAAGLDIVAFSLAGTDEVGNSWRRGVDFAGVCQAIATLRAARDKRQTTHPQIHIAYLLLASNAGDVAALPPLMQRLGVGTAVISTLDYLPDPSLHSETFPSADTRTIAEITALLADTAAAAERLGLGVYYQFPTPGADGNGCLENIGRSLFISADGGVSPCAFTNVPTTCADPHRRVFGNITQSDPLTIWESPAYQLFRDDLAKGTPDGPCQTCPKRFRP